MTDFRYFADARRSTASTWTDEPRRCDLCGETRPGYDGPYYGEDDEVEFVCEPCLVAGRLAEGALTANNRDPRVAEERTDELEHRTPHVITWQDLDWPVHCEDYCRFEREAGRRELEPLGGEDFFLAHLHEELAAADFGWDDVPPRAATTRDASNSPTVYFFRCTHCSTPVLWWDVD